MFFIITIINLAWAQRYFQCLTILVPCMGGAQQRLSTIYFPVLY